MQIGEALRHLRTSQDLTQIDAVRRAGVPDWRTLSHWEGDRKTPSLKLLFSYLQGLGLDFCDLQDALNVVAEPTPTGCRMELKRLRRRVEALERQLGVAAASDEASAGKPAGSKAEARGERNAAPLVSVPI